MWWYCQTAGDLEQPSLPLSGLYEKYCDETPSDTSALKRNNHNRHITEDKDGKEKERDKERDIYLYAGMSIYIYADVHIDVYIYIEREIEGDVAVCR